MKKRLIGERAELLLQPLSEPGLPSLHRIAGQSLPQGQRIIRRNIVDGADPQLGLFRSWGCSGVANGPGWRNRRRVAAARDYEPRAFPGPEGEPPRCAVRG